jgi:DNA mismatch endonuclease (patch repair protein)
MRSVHSAGTSAERIFEQVLHGLGVRAQRQPGSLPGRPDFVFQRLRLAIFVHGCFWHGHSGCENSTLPLSNVDYWRGKIDRNRKRDRRVRDALRKAGWRTYVVWECKLKNSESVARRFRRLLQESRRENLA